MYSLNPKKGVIMPIIRYEITIAFILLFSLLTASSVFAGGSGTVKQVNGNDITIELEQGDAQKDDLVRIVHITGSGMEIEAGTWVVTSVSKKTITASMQYKKVSPRPGMKAILTPAPDKKTEARLPETKAEEPVSSTSSPATKELEVSAAKGDAEAQFKLGRMYGKGEGVPQDGVQAVAWFRKAAEQGHAKAQNGLGVMYGIGQGVPQDWVQAVAWFRKAAAQGEPMAQCNLGVRYDNGQGVPQDHAQAAAWYRKAAEQGYAEGQFNLSLMYVNGLGVPQDYAQALVWYRRAAEQGYAAAQYNLGRMYETGRGVPQDNVEAHMWQDLAAARATGEDQKKFADGRDELARSMTPGQIVEAGRRAQAWTAAFALQRMAPATPAK
jgi:TPR repeat protein